MPKDKQGDQPPGMLLLSNVKKEYPNLSFKYVFIILFVYCFQLNLFLCRYFIDLITFQWDKATDVINLARVDPDEIVSKVPPGGHNSYPFLYIRDSTTMALCVDFVMVVNDFLREPKLAGSHSMKVLEGIMHSMEYERKVTTICLAINQMSIKTSVNENRWSYTSRPSGKVEHSRGGCCGFYFNPVD